MSEQEKFRPPEIRHKQPLPPTGRGSERYSLILYGVGSIIGASLFAYAGLQLMNNHMPDLTQFQKYAFSIVNGAYGAVFTGVIIPAAIYKITTGKCFPDSWGG